MNGQNAKAIYFFDKAADNITPSYREDHYNETGSPPETLFYLAKAYHLNNELGKAIQFYKRFRDQYNAKSSDIENFINDQINACQFAKVIRSNPVPVIFEDLGDNINYSTSNFNGVVSQDETIIVYMAKIPLFTTIMMSNKVNGRWSESVVINEQLEIDNNFFVTSLSADGSELYLVKKGEYDADIYVSFYSNERWSPVQKLNRGINTKFYESHACISQNKTVLYFTSNKKGGYGGLDVYRSVRQGDIIWGEAENLGPVVNSPYDEESPFYNSSEKRLYLSSQGHHTMGGYDVFYSDMTPDGKWTTPVNLGYPINSTDDDRFYVPVGKNGSGYYTLKREEGSSIFHVKISNPEKQTEDLPMTGAIITTEYHY